jgi:hypothetical protein
MNWLRERDSYEEIASFLAIKMKSTKAMLNTLLSRR